MAAERAVGPPPKTFEQAAAIDAAMSSLDQNLGPINPRRSRFASGFRVVFPQPQPVGAKLALVEVYGTGRMGAGRFDMLSGRLSAAPMNPTFEQSCRQRLVEHDQETDRRDVDLALP